jgi:Golgi nucleoside diphosphatase
MMYDAGSTETRLWLFTWPERSNTSSAPAVTNVASIGSQNSSASFSFSPPLASFANNVNGIASYLQPSLDYAAIQLSPGVWGRTAVYLGGTAGMRALPATDQSRILAEVARTFRLSNFAFPNDNGARTLTGQEEAQFLWTTANYINGTIQAGPAAANRTVGSLDLGGQSMQMAFVPAAGTARNDTNLVSDFQIGETVYSLYAVSQSGYGQDAVIARTNQAIILAAGLANPVPNPCYLVGYSELSNDTLGITRNLTGTGDYVSCLSYTQALLLRTAPCPTAPCSINGTYQPPVPPTQEFYAASAFFFTVSFLAGGNPSRLVRSPQQILTDTARYCSSTWAEAVAANPSVSPAFLRTYCLMGTYVYATLLQLGFANNTNQITFASKLGNQPLTWALGGMLYAADLLPFYRPLEPGLIVLFVLVGLFVLATAILGLYLFVLYFKRARREQPVYTRAYQDP